MTNWGEVLIVIFVMLVSSLFTATFIVAGIEYLYDKKIGRKQNEKKNNTSNSNNNTTK